MAPKLYYLPPSPPVRAVLMCAKALDLKLDLIPVDLLAKEHHKPEYAEKSPQRTVPLLEEEDGFVVADSHAIMAYLVAEYGKTDSLYPKNNNRLRATIDYFLHFDSNILFIRGGLLITKKLVFSNIPPTRADLDNLKDAFQILDTYLAKKKTKYIASDDLTIADFSITTSVTSWDIHVPYANYPHLKAYVERMEKLPVYEPNVEGLNIFKQVVGEALTRANTK